MTAADRPASRWRVFLDTLHALLTLAALVLLPGLFVFCIVANFTGDGLSDGEQAVAFWITVALGVTVLAGRIVSLLQGND